MNFLRLSKLDKIILGVGVLLIALLVIYSQFFSLLPVKNDLSLKQKSLIMEKKMLDVLTEKKAEMTTAKAQPEDTSDLQKTVPVQPLQEQVILDLEKAETVSNSEIKTMSFAKDVDVASPDAQAATNNGGTQQDQTAATGTDQTQADDQNGNQATTQGQATAAPTGLKKLTVQLQVESPTYEEFEKFIQTLEALTRTVVVESISYSGNSEVTKLEDESKPLSYSLTVSAFYMPNLTDLKGETPKIDAPEPAGKENPLSQFPTVVQNQP